MRDYGKVSPKFWTGTTGKAIRGRGFEGALVALYLMSSPHSNMLGLYFQPMMYLAYETGMPIEGASKGLQACIDAGFCDYDPKTEMVWVFEMAAYQVAPALKPSDKRCGGIQKDYDNLQQNPFLGPFFDKYQAAFNLTNRRDFRHVSEAPSKPHRSQEQEQEQEQEISTEQFSLEGASPEVPAERVVEHLPLVDGSKFPVTESHFAELTRAYPGVNIQAELRRMVVWLDANPRKRKTARGVKAFVVTWLTRKQDQPRYSGGNSVSDDSPWAGAK